MAVRGIRCFLRAASSRIVGVGVRNDLYLNYNYLRGLAKIYRVFGRKLPS